MDTSTPQPDKKSKAKIEDSRNEHRDNFISVPLKGGGELRRKLKWSNSSYHFTHPAHTSDPKGYYLYGVLNEVEKAILSVMQADEFVADSRAAGMPTDLDEDGQRIGDNVFQSRIDELSLWQRKMTELMVELQGFSSVNTDDYYRHYLALHELQSLHRSQADLKEYYNATNENYAFQEKELNQQIDALAPKLDPAKCWYAEVKNRRITHRFENFDKRFQYSFKKMRVELRATLRTQHLSFGNQSKSMHAGTSAGERQLSLDSIDAHSGRVVMLALHVVVMVKDLMHIQNTKGWLKTCADLIKKNDYPVKLHEQRTRPDIKVGDFVVVGNNLAQVVKVNISKGYGYKSFRVRYLKELPLPGIIQDEVPGDWVRLLYKREPLVKQTITTINKMTPNAKPTNREINKLLREGVIDGWDNGLKEYVQNRPADGEPKFEEYKKTMKKRYDTVAALAKHRKQQKNGIIK
jgi:hypothetical protein